MRELETLIMHSFSSCSPCSSGTWEEGALVLISPSISNTSLSLCVSEYFIKFRLSICHYGLGVYILLQYTILALCPEDMKNCGRIVTIKNINRTILAHTLSLVCTVSTLP